MTKLEEAKSILKDLNMPVKQRNNLCGYILLALSGIGEDDDWTQSRNEWMRIHDIRLSMKHEYKIDYAENSREAFRKSCLQYFEDAAFVENNGLATNSPKYSYRLTREMLELIRSYGSMEWSELLNEFQKQHRSLMELYESRREALKRPVEINGEMFTFSTGKHNELQKAIIEEFAPRFAQCTECLYVGDTKKKDLLKNDQKLRELKFDITVHDKMPDIVLYREDKNWLYFIEAVTSVGPMSAKRVHEIEEMTQNTTASKIYVTAFLDFKTYKKFSESIAWETEVWIAEMPDHMIHLNGDKFMGPRK